MKTSVWLLAVVLSACWLAGAAAQEATMDTFGPPARSGFAVLIPGQSPSGGPTAELSDNPQEPPASEKPAPDDRFHHPDPAALPSIPIWMRMGRSVRPARFETSSVVGSDEHCNARHFFLRRGLSAEAQARRLAYFDLIVDAACQTGVPVRLFDALLAQESRYRPFARSRAGAMGMAQLMPGTADYLGVTDPWDVRKNVQGGAQYLREQLDRFGSWELALAAYNAGPGSVERYGGIPPFRETRAYVRAIMATIGETPVFPSSAPLPKPLRRASLVPFKRASDVSEHWEASD